MPLKSDSNDSSVVRFRLQVARVVLGGTSLPDSSRGRRVRRAARLQHWHLIGRDFITDFLGTIVGRLVAVALPLLSPKTFMDPSPRFRRVGVKRLRAVVQWKGPRHAVVTLDGPHDGRGHLLAGVVEVRLELLR